MVKEPYKFESHGPWLPTRGVGKLHCAGCGLIALNNAFTRWCIDKGCNNEDHPQYRQKLHELTAMGVSDV